MCLAAAVRPSSSGRSGGLRQRGVEDIERESFGNGNHYDSRKTQRSPTDSKRSLNLPSIGPVKTAQKTGFIPLQENNLDGAFWLGGENAGRLGHVEGSSGSGAPAYGSVGLSSRHFGGTSGGKVGAYGSSSIGSSSSAGFGSSPVGFGQGNNGGGGYGNQGASFGGSGAAGSYGGSQQGYNSASQGDYGNGVVSYEYISYNKMTNADLSLFYKEPGMPYRFQYSVNEYGNNFGHTQASDGNQVTGRYYVQLPDGRLQTVDFKADPFSGYTADVQYEGQAQYPSNSGSGTYSSDQGSLSSGGYGGGIGGGSLGQLPLSLNGHGEFGEALQNSPPGNFPGPGGFSSKPY